MNVAWNKRRFIPVTRKGHPNLGLLFVDYFDLAAVLGPVVQVRVTNGEELLRIGRRESTSIQQPKADAGMVGVKVVKYRKVEIHKPEDENNLTLPSQVKYKTHSALRRRPSALEPSEEKDNNGHDLLGGGSGQVPKGPLNNTLLDRLRKGISSAAADVFQRKPSMIILFLENVCLSFILFDVCVAVPSSDDDDDDDEDSDFDSDSGSSDESSSSDDEGDDDDDDDDYSSDSSYSSSESSGSSGSDKESSSSSSSSSASALTASTAQRMN